MKAIFLLALASGQFALSLHAEPGWKPWDVNQKSLELVEKSDFPGLDAFAAELKQKGYGSRTRTRSAVWRWSGKTPAPSVEAGWVAWICPDAIEGWTSRPARNAKNLAEWR